MGEWLITGQTQSRALAGRAVADGNQTMMQTLKGLQAQNGQVLWWVGGRSGSKSKMRNGGHVWQMSTAHSSSSGSLCWSFDPGSDASGTKLSEKSKGIISLTDGDLEWNLSYLVTGSSYKSHPIISPPEAFSMECKVSGVNAPNLLLSVNWLLWLSRGYENTAA